METLATIVFIGALAMIGVNIYVGVSNHLEFRKTMADIRVKMKELKIKELEINHD